MFYKIKYHTPPAFSDLWISCEGDFLTGIWFEGSGDERKHSSSELLTDFSSKETLTETVKWLDLYFAGKVPDFIPPYRLKNLTPFRKSVIDCMERIPYGKTITYGDIAKEIAGNRGIEKMSAQAVGGAVGWNPICIIIPCHRVMGAGNKLTGYGGGIQNKIELLRLEGNVLS